MLRLGRPTGTTATEAALVALTDAEVMERERGELYFSHFAYDWDCPFFAFCVGHVAVRARARTRGA